MSFWERYELYTKEDTFMKNYLIKNNIIVYGGILQEVAISTNHTLDGMESSATATASIEYTEDIYELVEDSEDYGIDLEAVMENSDRVIEDYEEYISMRNNSAFHRFEKAINDSRITLDETIHHHSKKLIDFRFEFRGGIDDAFIIQDKSFYIVLETLEIEESAPYWGVLLTQALSIMKNHQYDLAFLLIFSAIENYISLLCEEYQEYFYDEVQLKDMELLKKITLTLKHSLGVAANKGRETHPCIEIIKSLYSDLYKKRNQVAHGSYREIDESDTKACMSLFIILHESIVKKPLDSNGLANAIKDYNLKTQVSFY